MAKKVRITRRITVKTKPARIRLQCGCGYIFTFTAGTRRILVCPRCQTTYKV